MAADEQKSRWGLSSLETLEIALVFMGLAIVLGGVVHEALWPVSSRWGHWNILEFGALVILLPVSVLLFVGNLAAVALGHKQARRPTAVAGGVLLVVVLATLLAIPGANLRHKYLYVSIGIHNYNDGSEFPEKQPGIRALLEAALTSHNDYRRFRACQIVSSYENPTWFEALHPLLDDRSKMVRKAALSTIAVTNDKRTFELVLSALEGIEKRRTREKEGGGHTYRAYLIEPALHQALKAISAQDFGENMEEWRRWWETNRPSYPEQLEVSSEDLLQY